MKITDSPLTAFAYLLVAATLLAFSSAALTQSGPPSDQGASARNTSATIEPVFDTGSISYANAWRISLDKQAESNGDIVFRIIVKDDAIDATRISISIVKGTNKADLAKIIEDALKSNAPVGVKIERNNDDEISLTAATGVSVTIDSSTIADLDINLAKE